MSHAKQISTNSKNATRKGRATATVSVSRICEMDATSKRCGRNPKGQEKVCSPTDASNAFLKVQFYPRLQEPEIVEDRNKSKLERDFFKSLSNLSKKFELTLQDCTDIPFPYNLSESIAEVRSQMKHYKQDWKEIRLIHHENKTYFAKEERYDTGHSLYYIPVIPLYTVLQKRKAKEVGQLLLSVYAYLFQVLGVSYYRIDNCYLFSIYEMLENWILEDEEQEESLSEMNEAKEIGDLMKDLITDPNNLQQFHKRLKEFNPKDDFENQAFSVANSFFELYNKFPDLRIDRNYYPLQLREEPEEDQRPIMLDDYLSFCASIRGNLFDTIVDTANSEFQEYCEMDEPTRFVPIHAKKDNENFDFEDKVFNSINDLIILWQEHKF
ncbi:hypothetical protein [Sphingobacterium siyangense]|uniref:hypothetical protein n=1 Tax=Sphingobacterium siyangense TaxID=459529 RepID=UPI001963C3F2|nr:hypothetical protein [Sphingobacterium siyangense]QRY55953.1 hypothetical protein JVX97_18210 [Sphingobacterium siyangense]